MLSNGTEPTGEELERAASAGPIGAVALCGIAVAIVLAIWIAFYFLAFLPRGFLQ